MNDIKIEAKFIRNCVRVISDKNTSRKKLVKLFEENITLFEQPSEHATDNDSQGLVILKVIAGLLKDKNISRKEIIKTLDAHASLYERWVAEDEQRAKESMLESSKG